MGEIADMMLDGTLCESCGEYMGDEGEGFPRKCSGCRAEERRGWWSRKSRHGRGKKGRRK